MWKDGPNIFDYATSELSQDAFFAWFLMWASDDYAYGNFWQLHKYAKEMIYTFFLDYGIDLVKDGIDKFDSIEINKQWNYIDLWIKINKKYNLVIEDKTKSKQHSDQLKRYQKYFKDQKNNTCFIYIKTGTLNSNSDKDMQKAYASKYKVYALDDIFKMLEKCKSDNAIFENYISYLRQIKLLQEIKRDFDDKRSCWKNYEQKDKLGNWGNNCLYIYFKNSLKTGYKNNFFAFDIYLKNNYLYLTFHIIKDAKGHWLENPKRFNQIMEKNKEKKQNLEDFGYHYFPDGLYYEKEVEYENLKDAELQIYEEILKVIEQHNSDK